MTTSSVPAGLGYRLTLDDDENVSIVMDPGVPLLGVIIVLPGGIGSSLDQQWFGTVGCRSVDAEMHRHRTLTADSLIRLGEQLSPDALIAHIARTSVASS